MAEPNYPPPPLPDNIQSSEYPNYRPQDKSNRNLPYPLSGTQQPPEEKETAPPTLPDNRTSAEHPRYPPQDKSNRNLPYPPSETQQPPEDKSAAPPYPTGDTMTVNAAGASASGYHSNEGYTADEQQVQNTEQQQQQGGGGNEMSPEAPAYTQQPGQAPPPSQQGFSIPDEPPPEYSPPQYPQYAPYQVGQNQSNAVIMSQPGVAVQLGATPLPATVQAGPVPQMLRCSNCNEDVMSVTHKECSVMQWMGCGGCCLLGCICFGLCCLGCCLIPFCIPNLYNHQHKCPNCHMVIGYHKQIS